MIISFKDKIIAALGYIPFVAFIPFLAPQNDFIAFHNKISFFLLIIEVFLLGLAFIPQLKNICFLLFTICLFIGLIGIILSLTGFYIKKK